MSDVVHLSLFSKFKIRSSHVLLFSTFSKYVAHHGMFRFSGVQEINVPDAMFRRSLEAQEPPEFSFAHRVQNSTREYDMFCCSLEYGVEGYYVLGLLLFSRRMSAGSTYVSFPPLSRKMTSKGMDGLCLLVIRTRSNQSMSWFLAPNV
jgi:hypothetical protein